MKFNLKSFDKIKGAYEKGKVLAKKNLPNILTIGNVCLTGLGTYFTVKATLKTEKLINEYQEQKADILAKNLQVLHTATGDINLVATEETKERRNNDIRKLKVKTGFKIAKACTPAFLSIGGAIGCSVTSNRVMDRRLSAATAAATYWFNNYDEYRKRVADKYGEDADNKLVLNTDQKQTIKYTDEDGKSVTEKCYKITNDQVESLKNDPWAFLYAEESCKTYNPNISHSVRKRMLADMEKEIQHKVDRVGWVSGNEALAFVGFELKPEGQDIGWVRGDKVSFGIIDNIVSVDQLGFANGYEPAIWLRFNCHSDVRQMIKELGS